MKKYYLYDIQNDNRIVEVDYKLYCYLYKAIFNVEALCTILMLLDAQMNSDIKLVNSIETLVDGDFMDVENKIYKIIEVEVD